VMMPSLVAVQCDLTDIEHAVVERGSCCNSVVGVEVDVANAVVQPE
jgi:hypothetical protein